MEKVFGVLILFLLFGFIYLLYAISMGPIAKENERINLACEQQGGQAYRSRDSRIVCIKKEALIEIK